MKTVDLHVHSTCSDGTLSPTELVAEAKALGLSAIALTDHDTVSGIPELLRAGEAYGVETIPGVELSTDYENNEIHVVGLFIDSANEALCAELQTFRDMRDNRNLYMIEKLQQEGFSITAEEIYRLSPDSVVARPHIARYLVETGQVADRQTVFDEYIGNGCRCYVERYKITPMRAVELIHEAGGLAILAHPCMYKKLTDLQMTAMVEKMVAVGLDAIEALYSRNQPGDEEKYRGFADKYRLLLSGGSDFHGANKPDIRLGSGMGNLAVPLELLLEMKAYRAE